MKEKCFRLFILAFMLWLFDFIFYYIKYKDLFNNNINNYNIKYKIFGKYIMVINFLILIIIML